MACLQHILLLPAFFCNFHSGLTSDVSSGRLGFVEDNKPDFSNFGKGPENLRWNACRPAVADEGATHDCHAAELPVRVEHLLKPVKSDPGSFPGGGFYCQGRTGFDLPDEFQGNFRKVQADAFFQQVFQRKARLIQYD